MTNEQAKKMLKAKLECLKRETSGTDFDCNRCNCDECSLNYEQGNMGEQKEALDMAIKALEQESCEDAISRQAVLSKIKEVCFSEEWLQFRVDNGSSGQRDFLINYIEQLPPVTPQLKTGRWINVDETHSKCDRCEAVFEITSPNGEVNYCPNCGTKMIEVQESEVIK